MINVDLVEEVEFYSGAFPATRGNALVERDGVRFQDGAERTSGPPMPWWERATWG